MKIANFVDKLGNILLPDFVKQIITNSKTEVPSSFAVANAIKDEYAIAVLPSNISFSGEAWQQNELSLTEFNNTSNQKLIFSNGKIKIGKNVSRIKVTSSFNCSKANAKSAIYGRIIKNGSAVTNQMLDESLSFGSLTTTTIFDVKENDVIGLAWIFTVANSKANLLGASSYFETYMMIEIIK